MPTVRVTTIVGARPQFVKAAAVGRAVAAHNVTAATQIVERIIHTGQHYDAAMSDVFFEELRIPPPAVNLGVGSASHGRQTAVMLERIEALLTEDRPDWVLVYGDTNSTLAGALAASKLHIPVAHVEAGLRSYNRRMPEEINRVLTDAIAHMHLCPTAQAVSNLAREGVSAGVHNVGDVMYDSLLFNLDLARKAASPLEAMGLKRSSYYLATLHRAENTDDPARLAAIVRALGELSRPVVWPVHPRTAAAMRSAGISPGGSIVPIEPVSYLGMLSLERHARLILTDSGGVQKEAYWCQVPCVTLRDETEWVELLAGGYNRLVKPTAADVRQAVEEIERCGPPDWQAGAGLYGDGRSGWRIVNLLAAA
jgi:UDP-N-acetylglucosamine 2-epimerase